MGKDFADRLLAKLDKKSATIVKRFLFFSSRTPNEKKTVHENGINHEIKTDPDQIDQGP